MLTRRKNNTTGLLTTAGLVCYLLFVGARPGRARLGVAGRGVAGLGSAWLG
jgi:hypothetical protein